MIGYLVLGVAIVIVSIDFIQLSFREPLDLEEVYSNRVYGYGVLLMLLSLGINSKSFGDIMNKAQSLVGALMILLGAMMPIIGILTVVERGGRKRHT
jgi:hypothetical protein